MPPVAWGLDPKTSHFTLLIDGIGVGQGARPFGDGLDVIYSSRGQKNFPMEFVEHEFPVEILTYAIHCDSGGPGTFRGGAGVVRDVRILAPSVTLGMRMNNLCGSGQYSHYWNDGAFQEVSYSTGADSAEMGQSGLRINMIPKDGGNTF